MKYKEFFNDKRKILKFTIIAAGISLVILLSVIGMTYATSAPQFCSACHIMKPEYTTWQASSHSQVSCTACHVAPGLTNALKHKVVAAKELYLYLTKSYELPIRMTEKLPDSRCLKCHSLKRKVSASTDLYIPHKRHYQKGIGCVKCHEGVAHGKVASSGMTMGGDLKAWDKAKGASLMTVQNTVPRMDLCMDCHGRRGVTVACEACHSGSMRPESHQEAAFKTQHGKQAQKNINYCDTCHAFIKAPGVVSDELLNQEEDPVAKYLSTMMAETGSQSGYADYAKTNEYCVYCHKKRPPSHNDQWPFEHGKEADRDNQKCLICHSPRNDIKGTTATGACSSCHPSIHKTPWRSAHPIPVPPRYAILDPMCFQCHVRDICNGCHGVREKGKDGKPLALPGSQPPPDQNSGPQPGVPPGNEQPGMQAPADNSAGNIPPTGTLPDSNTAPQVKVTIQTKPQNKSP